VAYATPTTNGSVAKFDFRGKIRKLGISNSMTYGHQNSRKSNFATEPEAFHTFEELPLPERFRKLAEWAGQHLSAADQEWIYQQWQQVLERSIEEPPAESALSVELEQPNMRGKP
jgi:hypothetical protein